MQQNNTTTREQGQKRQQKERLLNIPSCLLLRSSLSGDDRLQAFLLALLGHEAAAIGAVCRRGKRRLLLVGRLISVHFPRSLLHFRALPGETLLVGWLCHGQSERAGSLVNSAGHWVRGRCDIEQKCSGLLVQCNLAFNRENCLVPKEFEASWKLDRLGYTARPKRSKD